MTFLPPARKLHAVPLRHTVSSGRTWQHAERLEALTTRVDLAADARGDIDLEAELTLDWSRTQVYFAFCSGPKEE